MNQEIISKSQFDLLFKNNNCIVFYLEKVEHDYKIIYSNTKANKIFSEHIEGKFITDILPKSRNELLINHCNDAIQLKQEVECKEILFDNANVESKITLFPTFLKDKVYVLCIIKEVEIERELEEKNLFLGSIFGNTFLAALVVSKNGELLKINNQFLKKFDLELDDIKGKNLFKIPLVQQKYINELKQVFQNVINGNSITLKQLTLIDKNREVRNFITSFNPIMLTSKDKVDAVLIVLDEITQMQKQEKALKFTKQYLHNYKKALNSAAEVTITDANGYILDVNDRFVEQSGYTKEELIGKKHSILNSRYHSDEFFRNLWTTIKKGKVWRGEIRNLTKYGTYFWNDCTIFPLVDEEGEIRQFLSINFNITEKKRMIAELHNIEHMFKLITENSNDLIVLMNQDGIITYVSSAYERKLGYSKDELIGQFYTKLLSIESKQIWNDELSLLDHTENRKIELIHKAKNESEFWTECNYTVVKDYVQNKGAQIIMIAREISERKELENKLLFLAYHDALTQLPNRRYIANEFPAIIENAKKRNESVAVLYVDGDNFKKINDEHGHNVGDEFIYQFGKALSKSVRSHDVVARIGGDEFIIILTGLARNEEKREEQLKQIIIRLKENLNIGWKIGENEFSPTASIGVAFFPEHGNTLMELLENSDRALYDIKFSSKNDYKIYNKPDE